jgi:ABC-type uncharacterized transport system auxiliary subunit
MRFPRRIRLLEQMKLRSANLLLLLALLALAGSLCGCASTEADNASVRPWNTPQGWENGLGGMDMQRR